MAKTSKSLIELIDIAAKRHGGASGRRLAELAQRAGHDISHATLNRLRQGTYATRPSDASVRAIAYLADVSENTAFAAAGVRTPSGLPYQPPGEAQRMSTRQRKALDELIRAFTVHEPPAAATGVDFAPLLAARENLHAALASAAGQQAAERLAEAAHDAVTSIDEVIDALFAASADLDAPDGAPWSQFAERQEDSGPAHAVG
jgi:hypothetical protein